jgi:hypothetical protein
MDDQPKLDVVFDALERFTFLTEQLFDISVLFL